MNATAWLDQRAAMIRSGREGLPTAKGTVKCAEILAKRFPELPRETLGAVLISFGAVLSDAWRQLEELGDDPKDIIAVLVCLTDTAGEFLYAPEGGAQ